MNDINSYVWKDKRLTEDRAEQQVEYKLVDFDEYQLNVCYQHCKHMLYNTDKENPGRIIILDLLSKQIDNCGAELALRWFKSLTDKDGNFLYSNQTLLSDLRSWTTSLPDYDPSQTYKLQDFVQVPTEFKGVTIELLRKAILDSLGIFNHSKITLSFLYKLGVYFTPNELAGLEKYTEGHSLDEKLSVLKSQLGLPEDTNIKINPAGLNEQEFRDMIHLKKRKGYKKCKYSDLTTSQLQTLRNKVLGSFEEKVLWQAKTWKDLMQQIEEVAHYKKYKLS